MPKNEKNQNDAPAEYTPAAPATNDLAAENVTSSAQKSGARRLGTGAIIGLSAAGVALLAGVFGTGVAVANGLGDGDGHQQLGGQQLGEMAAGGQGQMQGQGRGGHGPQGQQGGQMLPGQMPGDGDGDGPRGGKGPHAHDANGNDIVPDSTATTTPDATTTN